MHFVLSKEHAQFYAQSRWISFLDLFSSQERQKLTPLFRDTWRNRQAHRFELPPETEEPQDATELLRSSYDLWRGDSTLKRGIFQKNRAQIGASLSGHRQLRIAYDQVLFPHEMPLQHTGDSLIDLSSITGLTIALLINISTREPTSEEIIMKEKEPAQDTLPSFFPLIPGEGLFFSAKWPIDLSSLWPDSSSQKTTTENEQDGYLLIVYGVESLQYIPKDGDPYRHHLQSQGYAFGDPLNLETHPLLFSH